MAFAILRADASPTIGGGHVMRCAALAAALRDDGWDVCFASSRETGRTIAASLRRKIPLKYIDNPSSADEIGAIAAGRCELFIVDHYGLDATYESACRSWARQIAVVDDLANRPHDCDILVDPTPGRAAADYRKLVPKMCTVLAGSDYALLRQDFVRRRIKRATTPRRPNQNRRLFMSFGQTDAGGLIAPALDAFARRLPHLPIDVAIAASAANIDAVDDAAHCHGNATMHRDVVNMAELMSGADIALVSASGTAAEAACLGLPIVLLQTAANQRSVIGAFANRQAADVANDIDDAVSLVAALCENDDLASSLGNRAASLYDGLGAPRVALAARPEYARDGAAVILRPAEPSDADLLLKWQSATETRRFARNPEPPSAANHARWLTGKLADPGCLFHIVLHANQPAGMVRLDLLDADQPAYEVSIFSAPGYYRRGIGVAALRLVRRLVPDAELVAEVLPDNAASHRLFHAAGYKFDGHFYRSPPPNRGS